MNFVISQCVVIAFGLIVSIPTTFAQELDLKHDSIVLHSLLNHMSDVESPMVRKKMHPDDPKKSGVDIIIDTKSKRIVIIDLKEKSTLYDFTYVQAFQGVSQSVALEPHQTMFMSTDAKVQMVVHDAESKTLNVIWADNQIHLFGYLSLKE